MSCLKPEITGYITQNLHIQMSTSLSIKTLFENNEEIPVFKKHLVGNVITKTERSP